MSSAKEIAEDRYAKGEITEEEFERIIARLETGSTRNNKDSEFLHIIECRKCGAEQDSLASNCKNCGIENPYDVINEQRLKQARKDKYFGIIGYLLLFIFISWLIGRLGGIKGIVSSFTGTCDVISTNASPDIFLTNGEPDYGYRTVSEIMKSKSSGDVTVEVTLSTGEGTFTKERKIFGLSEGETKKVTLNFPEPTVNTQEGQITAKCAVN